MIHTLLFILVLGVLIAAAIALIKGAITGIKGFFNPGRWIRLPGLPKD